MQRRRQVGLIAQGVQAFDGLGDLHVVRAEVVGQTRRRLAGSPHGLVHACAGREPPLSTARVRLQPWLNAAQLGTRDASVLRTKLLGERIAAPKK
jgi:hypothetical protein